jgi:RNA polymerase-interacting CarD/CdnL/TRCF family regulator
MKSGHASKPDIQAHIQSFLQTPEGQKMKAEASLTVANAYLQQILKQSNQPDLTIREKMLLNLALMEIIQELEKNEEILNLTMQSNVSEIS